MHCWMLPPTINTAIREPKCSTPLISESAFGHDSKVVPSTYDPHKMSPKAPI